jgi:hypothetical protein
MRVQLACCYRSVDDVPYGYFSSCCRRYSMTRDQHVSGVSILLLPWQTSVDVVARRQRSDAEIGLVELGDVLYVWIIAIGQLLGSPVLRMSARSYRSRPCIDR